MAATKIEWTEVSWNPLTGCTKVSPGCQNCYAERMAIRLQAMKSPNYANGFKLTLHEHALAIPYRWKKPHIIFVNSMSDLFHADVPTSFIKKVFQVMAENPHHTFQVLTKRSERLATLAPELNWVSNIWIGTSIESQDYLYRVDHLLTVPAKVRFLSCEPLLGSLSSLKPTGIDWIIVGGESGPQARPIKKEWVIELRDKCLLQNIPFFFKQWGGVNKKKTGKELDGEVWQNSPPL